VVPRRHGKLESGLNPGKRCSRRTNRTHRRSANELAVPTVRPIGKVSHAGRRLLVLLAQAAKSIRAALPIESSGLPTQNDTEAGMCQTIGRPSELDIRRQTVHVCPPKWGRKACRLCPARRGKARGARYNWVNAQDGLTLCFRANCLSRALRGRFLCAGRRMPDDAGPPIGAGACGLFLTDGRPCGK